MGLLIDSSVLIDAERHRQELEEFISSLQDGPFAVSAISASELLVGVRRAAPDHHRHREIWVESALARLPVLPFDLSAARIHAQLWSQLQTAGVAIGRHDILIAATALAYGYGVLTKNVRDFERVPGLNVRQPAWPS